MNRHFTGTLAVLALVAPVVPAIAQQDHSTHAAHHSAYAEQESSGIASLSRQEHDDLLNGAGMGLARPAKLNQYPGPKHVLELVGDLALSEPQAVEVEAIRAAMRPCWFPRARKGTL